MVRTKATSQATVQEYHRRKCHQSRKQSQHKGHNNEVAMERVLYDVGNFHIADRLAKDAQDVADVVKDVVRM